MDIRFINKPITHLSDLFCREIETGQERGMPIKNK